MNVVQHKDKSFDWLKWRKTGVGSSDAPVIMGVSEHRTPMQLWEEKCNPEVEEQETSFIQDKGNKAEVYARAQWCLQNGTDGDACLAQHQEHKHLLASADAFDQELKKGAEFKLASREDHERVRVEGICPQKYYPQVQHQMLVFGVKEWDYGSFYVPPKTAIEDGELLVITIKADLDWMVNYLQQSLYFWSCVTTKTPPELTDRDMKLIKKKEVVSVAQTYLSVLEDIEKFHASKKSEVDALNEQIAKILEPAQELQKQLGVLEKTLMIEAEQHERVMFGETGLSIVRSWRKGNVDYSTIPELLGVDLEQYRKPSTSSRSIKLPKVEKPKAEKKAKAKK